MVQQALPLAVTVLQILANVGIVITIVFLAAQTRASTKAAEEARLLRITELYRSVNLQFHEIVAGLPPEINNRDPNTGEYTTDLAALKRYAEQPGFAPGKAEKAIWQYFYMTRAEYNLCQQGSLTDEMWREWLSGICSSFQYPAFQEVWHQLYGQERPDPPARTGYYAFMELARTNPKFLTKECGTVQGLIAWSKRPAKLSPSQLPQSLE